MREVILIVSLTKLFKQKYIIENIINIFNIFSFNCKNTNKNKSSNNVQNKSLKQYRFYDTKIYTILLYKSAY